MTQSIDAIQQFASSVEMPPVEPVTSNGKKTSSRRGKDKQWSEQEQDDFLEKHEIAARLRETWKGGTKRQLALCPFCGNSDHNVIVTLKDGIAGFSCSHNSCKGKYRWHQFREHFEPDAYKKNVVAEVVDENKVAIVLGRQLAEEIEDILLMLEQANDPPELFVRGGLLTRRTFDELGKPKLDIMTETMLLSRIARSANYFKYNERAEGLVSCHPGAKHAGLIHALGSWPFPAVRGITEVPLVRDDGTILDTPGYDPVSCMIYAPAEGLNIPTIPEHPTQEEAKAAADKAFSYIAEFPYVEMSDFANACGLMLTVVIRILCPLVPLALINAPKPGTGKTLLFGVIGWLLTGRFVGTTTAPTSEEEWTKVLTGLLLPGTSKTFCLDNITETLRSGKLASFLTASLWCERILGSNSMPELENHCIPVATGNNIMLGGDIPRRCYRITMDADMSKPWERSDFTYHPLLAHIEKDRGEILAALLTMVRAWYAAGQPAPQRKIVFQDAYAEWTRIASGVLAFVGIDGFLENARNMYEEADTEGTAWMIFLGKWYELYQDKVFSTKALKQELEAYADEFAEYLPDNLKEMFDEGTKGFSVSLGIALKQRANTPFGDKNLRLVPIKNKATQKFDWKVQPPIEKNTGFTGFTGFGRRATKFSQDTYSPEPPKEEKVDSEKIPAQLYNPVQPGDPVETKSEPAVTLSESDYRILAQAAGQLCDLYAYWRQHTVEKLHWKHPIPGVVNWPGGQIPHKDWHKHATAALNAAQHGKRTDVQLQTALAVSQEIRKRYNDMLKETEGK